MHRILITLNVFILLVSSSFIQAQNKEFANLKPGKNKVSFLSEDYKLAAHLFLPDNYDGVKSFPSIVVVAPASGIKEQTAGLYAQKLAQNGFITLAFDHRTFGESEGEPRFMESAPMKVEDIKNAISYLATIPGVDKKKLAELGICSGAGYSIQTACFDPRIKAVATISGFIDFMDYGLSGYTQYMQQVSGDKIKQFQKQMQIAALARQKYFETGESELILGIPPKGSGLGVFWERAADYYYNLDRGGAFPTYSPKRAAMSLDTRYYFNASEHIDLMRGTPFLAIIGSDAYTKTYSKVAVERAIGDKELHEINGAHHFDLYDGDKYVRQAITKLCSFFHDKL
ncbi:MAG: alpha/beta hydrolase [Carboxylicivirga sp.]|jgi:fermentation-respiration switch protein FrsA (DUF1100 family)|nr:alpha/beta hydrolase [Carboxylicivirga sp.]